MSHTDAQYSFEEIAPHAILLTFKQPRKYLFWNWLRLNCCAMGSFELKKMLKNIFSLAAKYISAAKSTAAKGLNLIVTA